MPHEIGIGIGITSLPVLQAAPAGFTSPAVLSAVAGPNEGYYSDFIGGLWVLAAPAAPAWGDVLGAGDLNDTGVLRLLDVQIPQGATISSANLVWDVSAAGGTPGTADIDLQDVDTGAALTTTGDPKLWSVTGNAVTVTYATVQEETESLTAAVQAIINRVGWSAGGAINMRIITTGSWSASDNSFMTTGNAVLTIAFSE